MAAVPQSSRPGPAATARPGLIGHQPDWIAGWVDAVADRVRGGIFKTCAAIVAPVSHTGPEKKGQLGFCTLMILMLRKLLGLETGSRCLFFSSYNRKNIIDLENAKRLLCSKVENEIVMIFQKMILLRRSCLLLREQSLNLLGCCAQVISMVTNNALLTFIAQCIVADL